MKGLAPFNMAPTRITITPIANGILVEIPVMEDNPTKMIGSIVDAIKNMNTEVDGDDILNKIKKEVEAEEKKTRLVPDSTLYTFPNMAQALSFLHERFNP